MNLDNSTAAGEIVASPSNAASENMEKHSFEFSSAFLVHTVNSQSSTLAKAVLEGVMNSVDADASKIVIDLTNTSMVISDDGHGFRTREEVLACFKVFGFDHSEHAREFGRFGLGRAQLWAFASTVWRTSEFIFDVDVRERGFDWYLGTSESKVDGLRIEAKFYKELTNVEMVEFRSELSKAGPLFRSADHPQRRAVVQAAVGEQMDRHHR
ncbi:ATP-binding protein [Stenotrophomonas maltophilia]|uniref:ATP-binding protein n=1 Tax=Stenotrophomonas maltophilia TaxID=40324 RepID=UPI0039C379BA